MHPSRRKGFDFERELVREFEANGIDARRAWGSNGTTLTAVDGIQCGTDVDLLIQGWLRVQAKRRRSLATYLQPPAGADVSIIRQDRGSSLVVMPLEILIDLLKS